MTTNELLNLLAINIAKWPEVGERAEGDKMHLGGEEIGHWVWVSGELGAVSGKGNERAIQKKHWEAHRARIINEPSDSQAPEWANWKAQDSCGTWCWHGGKPIAQPRGAWRHDHAYGRHIDWGYASDGKTPAGHDWRETLRQVVRSKTEQATSAEEQPSDSQAQGLKDAITFTAVLIDSLEQSSAASEVLSKHLDQMMQHYSKGAICGQQQGD